MKRNLVNVAAMLAAAVLTGLGVATVTVGGTPALAAAATTRVYEFPASEQAAARVCYRAEREARGIPGERAAYVAWLDAHAGTAARADWHTAYQRCQDQHLWRQGKWNWSNMILVSGG